MQDTSQLIDLLNQALQTEYGISVKFETTYAARQNRRRLYAVRDKSRKNGRTDYDDLSMVIRHDLELLIIKRKSLPETKAPTIECRCLKEKELPTRILSRKKSRVGIHFS